MSTFVHSVRASFCNVLIIMNGDNDNVEMCNCSQTVGVKNHVDRIFFPPSLRHVADLGDTVIAMSAARELRMLLIAYAP